VSFYVSTTTFFLLHCDEWDRVVALPRHKFVHSELRDAEKKYKNLLNKKFKDYSQNMTKNLDELHSTNPKDFWKLLNKTVFPSGFYLNLNQGFSWQT
jgi:hypothetical protein